MIRNTLQKLGLLMLLVVAVSACSPTSDAPSVNSGVAAKEANFQRELAIKEQFALNQRLMDVSEPIMLANAELCGKLVTNYTGASFLTIDAAPKDLKATMKSLYGIAEFPTVSMLAANAPAKDSLQPGDVVTRVNGKNIQKGNRGIAAIFKALKEQKSSVASMRIKRAGQTLDVAVPSRRACDSPVVVAQDDRVNAVANGKTIVVTRGMMRFAGSDTELATVVGHELAHNSRKHIQAKQTNAVVGTIVGAAISVAIGVDVTRIGTAAGAAAHSHGFETEADYVGLYHAVRAGYDITDAANLWRRMAASNPGSIGFRAGTHPSSAKRFVTMEATVAEIKAKQEAGSPLVPEEKRAKALSVQKENS